MKASRKIVFALIIYPPIGRSASAVIIRHSLDSREFAKYRETFALADANDISTLRSSREISWPSERTVPVCDEIFHEKDNLHVWVPDLVIKHPSVCFLDSLIREGRVRPWNFGAGRACNGDKGGSRSNCSNYRSPDGYRAAIMRNKPSSLSRSVCTLDGGAFQSNREH